VKAVPTEGKLRVNLTETYLDPANPEAQKHGWEVSAKCNGDWVTVSQSQYPFASQRDAELAMNALIAEGLTDAASMVEAGELRVNEIMFGALPW
jgi:hypothetical protein